MEDYQIIELYWKKDQSASAEAEKKYGKYVRYMADRILGVQSECEQCFSETMKKAGEMIPPERPLNLGIWFGRLARTTAFHIYRERPIEQRAAGETFLILREIKEIIYEYPQEGGCSSEEELHEKIRRFTSTMSGDSRRIFIRRYWYMMPLREIASDCGMQEEKVVRILDKVRRNLRGFVKVSGMRKTDFLKALNAIDDIDIQDALPSRLSGRSVKSRHVWSMAGGIGFLLAVSLLFRFLIPGYIPPKEENGQLKTAESQEEAQKTSGISLHIPSAWMDCTERAWSASENVIRADCSNLDGTIRYTVFKSTDPSLIPATETEYEDTAEGSLGSAVLKMYGKNERYSRAEFTSEGYAYVITFLPSVTEEEALSAAGRIE